MPQSVAKILLIDDDEDDFVLTRGLLDDIPNVSFEVDWVQEYEQAREILTKAAGKRSGYDACLVDYRLGNKDGISFIRDAKRNGGSLPFILLTGQGDHEVDLAAMNAGAADFLDKSQLTADTLERALRYAIHSAKVEAQRARLLAVAEQQATQLRHLATQLTQAEQRERRRIAQTLHDHLQQLLVAAKMRIDRLQVRSRDGDQGVSKAVSQVQELIAESIEASRSLTMQLSPPVLHDRGLVPALEWLSRQFDKEHDLPVDVVADENFDAVDDHLRDFLFQAVRELLFNVVKHAEARSATVAVHRLNERIQVKVRDDGRGCDTSHFQEHPTGDGFGIFHLQQRVQFLGGEFAVESEIGSGCEVSLIVPMQLPQQRQRSDRSDRHTDATPAAHGNDRAPAPSAAYCDVGDDDIRVLLADDHKIVREGLAGLLREHPGIRIVGEASDGQSAIELCQQLQPDVVIMDISMPGLSGIEATRRIRAQCPGVEVIGLSMHEKADVAAAMRDAGAAGYFRKDEPSDGLIAAILQRAAASPSPLSGSHNP